MNKKLIYALSTAAVLASCTDDSFTSVKNEDAQLGKLVKSGLVSSARQNPEIDATTRALSPSGGFVWMPSELDPTDGHILNNSNQKVGFCWTGVDNNGFGAVAQAGVNVYTNYVFEHIGWLDADPAVTAVDWDECTGAINNGAFIEGEGSPVADWGTTPSTLTSPRYDNGGNSYYVSDAGKIAKGSYESGAKELGLGKGVFKTENSSVFQGEYLVYYPYTSQFTKGPIIANEPDAFDVVINASEIDRFATYSEEGFCLGWMGQYDGGNRSTGFTSTNFASFASIQIVNDNPNSTLAPASKDVETVILYSPSANILTQKGLNAGEAVKWIKGGATTVYNKETDAIYTTSDQDDHVATVYANVSDGTNPYVTIPGAATDAVIKEQSVIIPVLPQTVSDLQVLVILTDGTSRSFPFPNQAFAAGKSSVMKVNLYGGTYDKTYLAYDEPSLAVAMGRAYDLGAATAGEPKSSTIKILKNIDLEKANDGLYPGVFNLIPFRNNVTITADASNSTAGLTVKSHTSRSIKCMEASDYCTLTIDVPTIIEGYGCCDTKPGKVEIGGKVGEVANVVYTKKITNYGTLALGNSSTESNITIAELENAWDDDYVMNQISANGRNYTKGSLKRGLTTDAANLWIVGTSDNESNITIGKLTNNGGSVMVETRTLAGFEKANVDNDLTPNTLATKASRTIKLDVVELSNTGKLMDGKTKAESAADIAGGDILINYSVIATVGKLTNNNVNSIISVGKNTGESSKEGRIDITGISKNEGTIDNGGVINFDSSLDNDGLFIDRQNAQVGVSRVDCATASDDNDVVITKYYQGIESTDTKYETDRATEGIYVALVNSVERMGFVLSDEVVKRSAQVIEITDLSAPITFNVDEFDQDLTKYDVRVDDSNTVTFNSYDGTQNVEGYFANCLDVINGQVVLTKGLLKAKNVKLEEGTKLTANGAKCEVTIDNDLTVEKTALADINNKSLAVGNKTTVAGTFDSDAASVYTMKDVEVTSDGTFDSNGGANLVTGDFATAGTTSFAAKTSTKIEGNFSATAGTFEREELGGMPSTRATVNVGGSVSHTSATTSTAWPTKINL